MRSISGLRFDCGIPPRIKMDHGIGRRQVQPYSASLQADQKYWYLIRSLKTVDDASSIFRLAIQVTVGGAPLLQLGCNQFQHRDKLGKDQNAVSSVDRLFQQFP